MLAVDPTTQGGIETMWNNTRRGWGLVSILLHWVGALAIIGLFALGWWMTGLDYYDRWYNLGPWWHRSVGMLLLLATLIRLGTSFSFNSGANRL